MIAAGVVVRLKMIIIVEFGTSLFVRGAMVCAALSVRTAVHGRRSN